MYVYDGLVSPQQLLYWIFRIIQERTNWLSGPKQHNTFLHISFMIQGWQEWWNSKTEGGMGGVQQSIHSLCLCFTELETEPIFVERISVYFTVQEQYGGLEILHSLNSEYENRDGEWKRCVIKQLEVAHNYKVMTCMPEYRPNFLFFFN